MRLLKGAAMAVKYRNLGDREVICKGDQFLMYNNKWCDAMSLGNTPCDVGIRYRRPIDGKPRKTVRSAVQQRKAEIPPCQGCKGYGIACVQGAFRGGRICARERAKHSAVA